MKKITKLTAFWGLLSLALLFNACSMDDMETPVDELTVAEVIDAYGGASAINDISYVEYTSTGNSFEFQEDPEPVNGLTSNFTFDLAASVDAEELKQNWSITMVYAFQLDLNFTDIISGNQGVVNDGPNTFGSYAFGAFGAPTEPMVSVKLASRKKSFFMSSPLGILKQLEAENAVSEDNTFTTTYQGLALTVSVDPATKLITKISTLEADPLYGDVLYEVLFSNWVTVDNIKYPSQIDHILKGEKIREEVLSDITFSQSLPANSFDFDGTTPPAYDATQADKGYLSSQFYFRAFMQGFPFDVFDEQEITSSFDASNEVLHIAGIEHYSYAFKVGNEVVIYDAPMNAERQLAVLNEVNQKFPGLSIKSVVISHDHFDHAGGFRGALSAGGDLVVGQGSVSNWNDILTLPHTLVNNPLTSNVTVTGVNTMLSMGTGTETIEIYTASTIHASSDDMLIIYKPSTKTIYYSDLYNAGFINIMGFFPNLATTIKARAQDLVNFVNTNSLDVEFISPTHGDLTDNTYQSVINAAQ